MAIRDFLIFDDTTPVPEEAQLGSGDTARLMLDSARAMVVLTEAEADVFVIDTVAGIVTMSSVGVSGAIPTLAFYDTDCGDGDVSASIVVDATTTTTNIEEVDFSIYQQKTGTLTRTFFSDIDQGIWLYPLGESANPVSITTGGDLNIASKLTHDGDADTYLQFSADQLQLIVGGATAFNYDEGALNTLAIDQEGTADISFGGGNVFIGGSEGSYDTKVGVGTITPLRQLSISKDSDNADIGIYCYHDTEASSSRLFFNKADGSEASPTLVDDNAVLGEIISAGYDGVNFGTIGARIKFIVNGTPTTNRMPTDIEFYTAEGAGDDDIALAMTIANNANVGIETENLATWTSTVSALQVGGTAGLSSTTTQANHSSTWLSHNAYHDSSTDTWKFLSTNADDEALSLKMVDGLWTFRTSTASGSANGAVSWSNQLILQNASSGLSATFGGDIIVPQGNKIHLDSGQEWIYSDGTNMLFGNANGAKVGITSSGINLQFNDSASLRRVSKSFTDPTYSIQDDTNTGMTSGLADTWSVITGGVEAYRWTETAPTTSSHINHDVLGGVYGDNDAVNGDYVQKLTATLNDTVAGTTEVFRAHYIALTETDASGWGGTVYLADWTVGGTTQFNVTTGGDVSFTGDLTLKSGVNIDSAGAIAIRTSGDTDDYVEFTTVSDTPTLSVKGGGGLIIDTAGIALQLSDVAGTKEGILSLGNTAATEASFMSIVDGGTDKPGYLQLYTEAGSGMYFWVDSNNVYSCHTSGYGADPEGTGVKIIDLDTGLIGAVGQAMTCSTITLANSVASYDGLSNHREMTSLADDAEIALATGVSGWGTVMIGDMQEWVEFTFTQAGVVTIENSSANVADADTDGNLCVYDAGSGISIKNRLGGVLNIAIDVKYY